MQPAVDRTLNGRSTTQTKAGALKLDWAPGHLLAGRYQIRERIGQGRTGAVFRVLDRERGRDLAVKIIYPWLLTNSETRKRFCSEANRASELYHPAIANLIGLQTDGDVHFLVMELLRGQTLRQWLSSMRRPLPEKTAVAIVKTLASALHYAHNKLVHANLKPENIWIDEGQAVKIMDFGVAALLSSGAETDNDSPAACYLAPEQAAGGLVDKAADQYALGVLMLELLRGEVSPRRIRSARRRLRRQPRSVAEVTARMLAARPEARFSGAEQVAQTLSELEARPGGVFLRWLKTGLLILLLLGAASWGIYQNRDRLEDLRAWGLAQWETLRPVSAAEQQLRFSAVIERVNEVNGLSRLLTRAQREQETRLKAAREKVRAQQSELQAGGQQPADSDLAQSLEQARTALARERSLAELANRLVFDAWDPLRIDAETRGVLALVESQQYDDAIARIEALRADLRQRVNLYHRADDYLRARFDMLDARLRWSEFAAAQSLQPSAAVRELAPAIAAAENLADQGRLDEAGTRLTEIGAAYREAHARDRERVAARAAYRAQRLQTQRAVRAWRTYLNNNGLTPSATQNAAIAAREQTEQRAAASLDFGAAQTASRELEQEIAGFHDSARERAADLRRQQAAERAARQQIQAEQRRTRQAYARALADGETLLAQGNFDGAIARLRAALEIRPGDGAATRLLNRATLQRQPPEISRFAPGIELALVPAGGFAMGGGGSDEQPLHRVRLGAFKLMKHEVTFTQYDRYAEATGRPKPADGGWGRGNQPVINVNWEDANLYAQWLSRETGYRFRLPTEAEWEYAARAGTESDYPWGQRASRDHANYGQDLCCGGAAEGADRWIYTAPVGSFPANPLGLADMHGNVTEWVQDCWNPNYIGAPADGSAWLAGDCQRRVVRGGTWSGIPEYIRSASRDGIRATSRTGYIGFRLAQDP